MSDQDPTQIDIILSAARTELESLREHAENGSEECETAADRLSDALDDAEPMIQAAPAMLDALEDGLTQIRQMQGMFDDEDGAIAAAVRKMETAIAAARDRDG